MTAYYRNGPLSTWRERFVSAYATMHAWEDFAETFATYLDMASVLDCAQTMDSSPRRSGWAMSRR